MDVETWRNGGEPLPSDCSGKYNVCFACCSKFDQFSSVSAPMYICSLCTHNMRKVAVVFVVVVQCSVLVVGGGCMEDGVV